jgi:cytochrome c nitrite reductase small subunit
MATPHPPRRRRRWSHAQWPLVGITLGLAVGIGAYTFIYAKGASYLTDNPQACANCHVMNEQYSGWIKSPHRNAATCNDCHTPSGFFAKYATKASNGFWHSFYFTTGGFHEPIQIRGHNRQVTEGACRKCHTGVTSAIDAHQTRGAEAISCLRCHRNVGHMH